jgi:hypothetical protein
MAETNELKLAIDFFRDWTSGNRVSLHIGAALRQEMFAEIKAGKSPTGYRHRWLQSSSNTLITVLAAMGEKFSEQFPGDRVSTDDLCDMLRLTADKLDGIKRSS